MAKSSRLFYLLAGLLAVLIVGLAWGIFEQRASRAHGVTSAQLDIDSQRLEVIHRDTQTVVDQLPALQTRHDALLAAWQPFLSRFSSDSGNTAFETLMAQVASAARFDVTRIEVVSTAEVGAFRERTYHVRMLGAMMNLPAWAEALYRQPQRMITSRISVVSPDYQFQRVRIKATITVYQPLELDKLVTRKLPLERLAVDLTYSEEKDENDPELGDSLKAARAHQESIARLTDDLKKAEGLERAIAGYEALLKDAERLIELARTNRQIILTGLPTLYIRVRNSPLGSCALIIQGKDAIYPEVTVDD